MKKFLIIGVTFIIVLLIGINGIKPVRYDIKAGGTAPADMYAKREIVDELTTEKRRAEAEEGLSPVYDTLSETEGNAVKKLNEIFGMVDRYREEGTSSDYDQCLSMSPQYYGQFRTQIASIQKNLYEKGITDKEEALSEAEKNLSLLFDSNTVQCGLKILSNTVEVNKVLNIEKTEAARDAILENVPDVIYKANQIIVRKGDIVTQEQYNILSELGMVDSGGTAVGIKQIGGMFGILLICFVLLWLFSWNDEKLYNDNMIMLTGSVLVLNMLMSLLGTSYSVSIYILPIITGCVLLSILADIKFAILYNMVVGLLCTIIFGGNVYFLVCIVLSGSIAAFVFIKAKARYNLVYSAVIQCCINLILYASSGFLEGAGVKISLHRGLMGMANGAITSILVIGILPFLEYTFDVTTPFKLLELSNSNNPLLKRLLVEAPGTYHHSLMVGNLSEAACEVIGGNPLLARTGAYYHDVGKLKKPQYFKENQYSENPHDKMAPELSASVIVAHVNDGAELAKQYRLPGAIRKIISTHHGNSPVSYFYHKAKVSAMEGEIIDESKFRYKDKKPGTKEEAVVMLADSVEAAVRTLEDKSETSVQNMVHKIIESKLNDGQLNQSGMTLRDIENTELAFVKVFGGYFHSRIKYPDVIKREGQDE